MDMINNHKEFGTPYNFNLFEDDYGYPLRMNWEAKTNENAKKYFDKLCTTLGSDYKLNYYEVDTDDELRDITFSSTCEIEKIIRLIALERDKFDKSKNLKLGIITIDLTNVIAPNGKQVYKGYFEKVRKVLKDNELCNI